MKITRQEVIDLLDAGHLLIRVFYPKVTDYQINKRRVNSRTAESLIHGTGLKLVKMDFNGITKHYYGKPEN